MQKIYLILIILVTQVSVAERSSLLSDQEHENIVYRHELSLNHSEKAKLGPVSKVNDNFICFHDKKKVPVNLRWSEFAGADSYDIEVYRLYKNSRYNIKTEINSHHIMIYPNARYKWKVTAYKDNKIIGQSSKSNQLYIMAAKGENSVSKFEDNFEDNSGKYVRVLHLTEIPENQISEYNEETNKVESVQEMYQEKEDVAQEQQNNEERLPANTKGESSLSDNSESLAPNQEPLKSARKPSSLPSPVTNPDYWVKVGGGLNLMDFEQEIGGGGKLSHKSTNIPNLYLSAGKNINKSHGVQFNYIFMPGQFTEATVGIDEKFNWQNFSLEGVYRFAQGDIDSSQDLDLSWRPYLKYGVHYHLIPILEVQPTLNSVEIADNTFWTIGAAIGVSKVIDERLHVDLSLRYQHPVSAESSVNTYELDSGQMIDVFIETGYRLNSNSSVNVFLNTQFFKTEYSSLNGSTVFEGTQTIFNNILGVNYGYEF